MTDTSSVQDSLALMGFWELALAFAALCSYALALNGSITTKARLYSTAAALLAAAGLIALTSPWTNGVIVVAIGIVGIGAFVAAVWAVSAACGFRSRPLRDRATTPIEPPVSNPTQPAAPAHSSRTSAHSA